MEKVVFRYYSKRNYRDIYEHYVELEFEDGSIIIFRLKSAILKYSSKGFVKVELLNNMLSNRFRELEMDFIKEYLNKWIIDNELILKAKVEYFSRKTQI